MILPKHLWNSLLIVSLSSTIGSLAAAADAPALSAPVNHTVPSDIGSSLKPSEVKTFGTAPGVTWQVIDKSEPRTWLIVMGANDDLIAGLKDFAASTNIVGGAFTGIGGLGAAAIGFYEREPNAYRITKITDQTELVAFSGNVGQNPQGKRIVHAHGIVAGKDSACLGGHFMYASAWPTVEIVLKETTVAAIKEVDDATGLSLYALPEHPAKKP